MRVTDIHVHIQPWEQLLPGARRVMAHGHDDFAGLQAMMRDPEAVLRRMDDEGIARIGIINYVSPGLMGFTREVNDFAADVARHAPERLIPFGGVDPGTAARPTDEVDRIADLGIRAIKIHPPHQEFAANAYRHGLSGLAEVYGRAEELGLPVMIHTGTSIFPGARNVYADPMAADDVGVDFPELTVILAHLGRPLWPDAAFFLLRRHENFHGDVSGIPPKRLLEYFPRLPAVADRILWGTDWPGPMVPGMRKNLDAFLALNLPDEAKRAIVQDNAERLFGPAPEA